jgi:hypothetical protein
MPTVLEGSNAALMVVDVQVGVMTDAWDASRISRGRHTCLTLRPRAWRSQIRSMNATAPLGQVPTHRPQPKQC